MPKRRRSILDDMPANETEAAADQLQWILFLEEVMDMFNWPVNTRYLVSALRDLRTASSAKPGNAYEVRLAWQLVLDVAGPILTGRFISSGTWREYTPYVRNARDTPSRATVWQRNGKAVVCRARYQKEVAVDLAFHVEDGAVSHF
jgi:hypothetical protein